MFYLSPVLCATHPGHTTCTLLRVSTCGRTRRILELKVHCTSLLSTLYMNTLWLMPWRAVRTAQYITILGGGAMEPTPVRGGLFDPTTVHESSGLVVDR